MPKLEPEVIAQRMELYRQRRAEVIQQHGWIVQGVFPTENDRPIVWNYTIGMLNKFGFELITFGIRMELAQVMFNGLGQDFREGVRLDPNKPLSGSRWFQGDIWYMFKKCRDTDELYHEWLAQATDYHHRAGFDVYQVVLCDKNGKFPGEPGYDEQVMGRAQPILY